MLKKLRLILNTVIWLKPTQIFYQIYYRLVPKRNLLHFKTGEKIQFHPLIFDYCQSTSGHVHGNKFRFLNLEKDFKKVDWGFSGYGKLWNYNLQYLNYLHQPDIEAEYKDDWLIDIDNWLTSGKLKLEPYPVSLRIMNAFHYYSNRKNPPEEIVSSLYAQAKYLYNNFEYHLLGNHLLENAFGLIMSAAVFRNIEWEDKAKNCLQKQLEEQILSDGAHFELSPMYHQVILFRLLELIDWYRNYERMDKPFLLFLQEKGKRMLTWLRSITFINGDIPHFNDSTNGIAYPSFELFKFANILGLTYERDASLGASGYKKFLNKIYECIVDVGELGASYQPGHSHADALSFILYYKGRPFIDEVGTSTYEIGSRRNYERSTSAHNTVVIAQTNQSEVWGGFRAGSRAKSMVLSENESELVASHDGYSRRYNVIHKRYFQFLERSLVIHDDVQEGAGQLHLHFHPSLHIYKLTENTYNIGDVAIIEFENATKIILDEFLYSEEFNKYSSASKIILSFCGRIKTSINFI